MKTSLILALILALMIAPATGVENNVSISIIDTKYSAVEINSPQIADPPGNDVFTDTSLIGTCYSITEGVHGNALYCWSFGNDGRFAYLFSGYEPPQGDGSIDSSVRERFMKGKYRVNGDMIELYDIVADDFSSWGDNWKYFPDRDPIHLAWVLLDTPLIDVKSVNNFSIEYELTSVTTLRLKVDLGDFPDQYDMEFEYIG